MLWLRDTLTEYIETDMLSISFVEGIGFRLLMQFVEPDYYVPCRNATTTRSDERYAMCKYSEQRTLADDTVWIF